MNTPPKFCTTCGKRLGGEGQIHTCTPPEVYESLYDRTGDIKDINTMLVGRDALQELEEIALRHEVPKAACPTCVHLNAPAGSNCCYLCRERYGSFYESKEVG